MKIGFVIISHSNPVQLQRLVRTLRKLYDDPPLVCAHDFSQASLTQENYSGVQFVSPHVKTRWGKYSIVEAALRALELLYEHHTPDWFYLLSGADYPTRRRYDVVQELKTCGVDAFLDFREAIDPRLNQAPPPPGNSALSHFISKGNRVIAWQRYVGMNIWIPTIRRGPRLGRYTIQLNTKALRSPFGSNFKCYYGDQWFSGNAKVAKVLLNPTDIHLKLRRYLKGRTVPDECYYQSILANASELVIDSHTRRYARWNGGGAHPQMLGESDLPEIIASKAHFSRKFSENDPVLDSIDRLLFR